VAAEVWVKTCGLRTADDVRAAEAAGADAVGFVLAASVRQVPVDLAARLAAGTALRTYAVTVDLHPDEVEGLLERAGVDGLQPHGQHGVEAATVAAAAGAEVLLPVPVVGPTRPGQAAQGFTALLDTPSAGHGGSGRRFDWDLIEPDGADFVLAGGLGPDTVAEAIAAVRPWGVDASSGLEASPGRKDPAKITAFVTAAKAAGRTSP
jgi:phosphoribosylanthranilate isomerase